MLCDMLAQVAGMALLSALCCHVCCHLLHMMHMRQCQCSPAYHHNCCIGGSHPLPSLHTVPPAARCRVQFLSLQSCQRHSTTHCHAHWQQQQQLAVLTACTFHDVNLFIST